MKKGIFAKGIRIGTVSGAEIFIDPFIIITFTVIIFSGGAELLLITLPALAVHEISHIIAAYLFECRITGFRLSAMGGTLYMDPFSGKRFCEEAAVYLFAPLVNIMLYSVFYAIGVRANDLVMLEISLANGAIAIFSLIPAVPLDGGSVLKAFLYKELSGRSAKLILLTSNVLSAAALLFVFFYSYFASGDIIWQLLSLSFLLITSGTNELRNSRFNMIGDISNRDRLLSENGVLPENRLSVSTGTSVARALKSAKSGYVNVFSVYDEKMILIGKFTEQELLSAAIEKGAHVPVGSLVK